MRLNILVDLIRRNGGVEDAMEYFGRVHSNKWMFRGCEEYSGRVDTKNWRFWRMRLNIVVE